MKLPNSNNYVKQNATLTLPVVVGYLWPDNCSAIMRTSTPANTHQAEFLRAMDGDTIAVCVHLPFGVHLEIRVRLLDLDSWELNSEHRAKALECAARVNAMLRGVPLVVHVTGGGRDRYGRWRAIVYCPDGPLADKLLAAGIAWKRQGKTASPVPPSAPTKAIQTAHLPPPTERTK